MRAPRLLTALLLAAGLALMPGCGKAPDAEKRPRIALLLSVGGLGDKSFNDSAHEGLMRAQKELPVKVYEGQPTMLAEDERYLRSYASRGFDLIIAVGFLMKHAVVTVAKDFPKARFALIDAAITPEENVHGNIATLLFKEEEGCFLVGAAAILASKTGKVGFVGGMDIPLIRKFQRGYEAGVRHIKPDATIFVEYAGTGPEAFSDPMRGKQLGSGMIAKGGDVLFHASGSTGNGVIEAASEARKLAIGVDANQDGQAPGAVLTSMIKRVDIAVYQIIADQLSGKYAGKPVFFGLAKDAVGTTDFAYMRDRKAVGERMDPATLQKILTTLEGLKADILSGKIVVPGDPQ